MSSSFRRLVLALSLVAPAAVFADQPKVPAYELNIRLFPDARRIEVEGTVVLPAVPVVREQLRFKLSDRLGDLKVTVVEPAPSRGPALVAAAGELQVIRPATPIPADQVVKLQFSYRGGERRTPRFYLGPEVGWISGEAFAWYPQLEGARRATGTLVFTVPKAFVVDASGTNLTRREDADSGTFRFAADKPTTFSFAAARYTVHRSPESPRVALYLLRPRPNVPQRLALLQRILSALEQEFGPYPHGDFELVELPSGPAGGSGSAYSMEGFVVSGEANLDTFNIALLAHEMSHQWWADSIFPGSSRGAGLLTEAMAQYGALQAVEMLQGSAAAEKFRRTGYPGYEFFQNALGYVTYVSAGYDAPLTQLQGKWFRHTLANSKGFFVHDMLSRTVGRKRFRAALHEFTREHAFSDVTWDAFLAAVRAQAGRELRWFYDQWYERAGLPDWHLAWQQHGNVLTISVAQPAPYYRARLEVLIKSGDRSLVREIEVSKARHGFVWPVHARVSDVELDPHYKVLRWTADCRAEAQALKPIVTALMYFTQGKSQEGQRTLEVASSTIATPDRYGLEFLFNTFRFFQALDSGDSKQAQAHLEAAISGARRRNDLLPNLYYYRGLLAKESGDENRLKSSVAAAATADAALVAPSGWADAARALLYKP